MPSTKNILAYASHSRVLDAALERAGIRLTLESAKHSMKWRQEANYFRTLLRKSYGGVCKYDCLVIKLDTHDKSTIVIEHRQDAIDGILTDLEGNTVEPPEATTEAPMRIPLDLSLADRINLAVNLEIEGDD